MNEPLNITRRYFLGRGAGVSLGAMAWSRLARGAVAAPLPPNAAGLPHFAAKAKHVIFLTQSGGPSQLELYDHKPELQKWAGIELPDSVRQGQRVTTMTSNQKQLLMPGRTKFEKCGRSGATIGEWLPHLRGVADDLCFIKSMHSDQINHAPAMTQFLTGHQIPGRPSMGAWVSYGLGSENQNLPEYLVLISKMQRPSDQPLYDHYWGSGFLPSRYQGVKLRNSRDPVLYLHDPDGMPREIRRGMLDGLGELNQMRLAETGDPEIATRIRQYEMAYRMQTSVPELTDLSGEPESTFALYGPDSRRAGSYAANCILARRLIERGVRFVELSCLSVGIGAGGAANPWDQHGKIKEGHGLMAHQVDQPVAALIQDLKQRGLFERTLIIFAGEFGRTPVSENGNGRDHNPHGFSMWLAGGGVKGGQVIGSTDAVGLRAESEKAHVHDIHATILHLLGLDHTRLTFRRNGRNERLTDVAGNVIRKAIA